MGDSQPTPIDVAHERVDPIWPGAARKQLSRESWEWQLFDLARKTNKRISWWWGTRSVRGKAGAHCYVCGTYMATWPTMLPPSGQALRAIELHRDSHSRLIKGD